MSMHFDFKIGIQVQIEGLMSIVDMHEYAVLLGLTYPW